MIEFRNVSYSYPNDAAENLRNINLQIGPGEFIVITGKSGCGKTTLSKCINGLIPYFHEGELTGDALIGGVNTKQMALHEIGAKVGSVFQDPAPSFLPPILRMKWPLDVRIWDWRAKRSGPGWMRLLRH
jgi:energy-coupling factor transporter ATP-binding protein EcfA2